MTKLQGIINNSSNSLTGSIKGEANISVNMQNGARGKSAYEIWLEKGSKGTKQDFLDSLKASAVAYEALENKPKIESVELVGDKTFEDLGFLKIENTDILKLL